MIRARAALFRTALAASACIGVGAVAHPSAALEIGDALVMKDVRMRNIDGSEVSIGDVTGEKGTLVIFQCNSCPWVKAWEDRIATLGNTYRKRGIGVVAINSNDPSVVAEDGYENMKTRARKYGFEFPYVVDAGSKVARAFGAERTPEAFLFDAGGKLVYHGTIDDDAQEAEKADEHYLRDALAALTAGREIRVKTTKALGCSIKFYPRA
jgi:peroxiredoxin